MRCVLFDLDGTLLNTIEGLQQASNEVLTKRGLPTHSVQEMREMVGEGIEILVHRALPEGCRSDVEVQRVVDEVKEAYARVWESGTKPYPGIPELLAQLEERGVDFSVLSNKPDEFTGVMVRRFFPGVKFRQVRGAMDGVPKKPEPDVALLIAREMGYQPGQAVFVGDTWVDIQTGVRAGMRSVGVAWGFRDEPELVQAGAQFIIQNPLELLDKLD